MSAHDDTAELLAFAALDDNKRLIAERDRLRESNRELLMVLKELTARFHACAIAGGSDKEFVDIACAKYRGLIARATGTSQ